MSEIPWALGEVRNYGFGADNHEYRERCEAIVECPKCDKDVYLLADTEEHYKGKDGRWHHSEYSGFACGVCCGLLIVDGFEGCEVYRLEDKHA